MHELKIVLDSIRDFGEHSSANSGPQFGCTYYGYTPGGKYSKPGYSTIGVCLYLSRTPKEAMEEALRIAANNDWTLLQIDVQGGSSKRLGLQTCTHLFVSEDFTKYMKHSQLAPLPYDTAKWGPIKSEVVSSYIEKFGRAAWSNLVLGLGKECQS